MVINEKNKEKVRKLLADGKSFALFRLPGHAARLVTKANVAYDFYITPWRTNFENAVHIGEEHKPLKPLKPYSMPEATDRDTYVERVGRLVEKLGKRGMAKTVISRVITGCNPDIDWPEAAERLWDAFPDTFGFLFYTPQTGAWLGASPEKLLITHKPDLFSTQALAGTMPADSDWDVKNYQEHQMVIDFIESALRMNGIEYTISKTKSQRFGSIKHLCTNFSGKMSNPQYQTLCLLDWLPPTPALAGWPREDAIDDIDDIEDHDRGCYGGFLTVSADKGTYSYVTLRCASFDPSTGRWVIYAGGGITPKSDPESEWAETEAKAHALLDILQNTH